MELKGIFKRFPKNQIYCTSCWAFLSLLVDRLDPFLKAIPINGSKPRIDMYAILRHLYYDVAGFSIPRQLGALLDIVDPHHLLYGSDYHYTPTFGCEALAGQLNNTRLLSDRERNDIFYNNADRLFNSRD